MPPRRTPMPIAAAAEELEVRTSDGRALRGEVREPPRGHLVGVAVLAHAMMARRTEFERPRGNGLSAFFAARGWRTIAFDFRGHGDSAGKGVANGETYTYDDFVLYDLPAVVACARARAKKLPVVVVGHSLGGHVALAAHGLGLAACDAVVCVAANVWLKRFEPSAARWIAKRGVLAGIGAICRRRGYFPARALRIGSDDEPAAYFAAFERWASTNAWTSDDGSRDYLAAIADVRVPVLQIASDADRLSCHPASASRFLAHTGGSTRLIRVSRGDDGGSPPGHMELVTSERARRAWDQAELWMREKTGANARPAAKKASRP